MRHRAPLRAGGSGKRQRRLQGGVKRHVQRQQHGDPVRVVLVGKGGSQRMIQATAPQTTSSVSTRPNHGPPVAAARDAPTTGQQQQAERIEQQQVLVGPAGVMRGAEPDEEHQRAEQPAERPERQRHRGKRTWRTPANHTAAQAPRRCPTAPTATMGVRTRQAPGRCGVAAAVVRTDKGPAIGAGRLAQAVGQAHGDERFLPARQRHVGERPQADVEAQPHPRRRRGQAHRFAAVGVAARASRQLLAAGGRRARDRSHHARASRSCR